MSKQSQEPSAYNHGIQLEQKLLHYRSEIKKFQRIIHLQKNKISNQEEELKGLKKAVNNQSTSFQHEVDHQQKTSGRMENLFAYFAYSILFPKDSGKEVEEPCLIRGNFIVRNLTNQTLHEPLICLSFNKPELANLSGKVTQNNRRYSKEHLVEEEDQISWKYLDNHSIKKVRETGEFWLKPNKQELVNSEELSFNHFEILLPYQKVSLSVNINGYIYGREIPEGQRAINSIICNIT
ncbi:hypothetical protein [Alkalicoccobacillus porphyridii]|uniref:Uncharacterized protein n=1 Tax=Alkalicoccobacillus porphyridii TaxID=2597270 RepID=A0A553ZXA3_9BACI|nr:hypothetical protein [Alkalicoccobacillus porphyridii]TSB46089.1 hypothetical protein FN960_12020 [Alkalicoccobacillus porphyridii]